MSSDPSALPSGATSAVDRENPWPGLGSYDESMNAFFFGRDMEIEELLRLVRRDAVALFYGQSGLGKSSLLQAGLFPKLRAADLLPVHVRLRFGADFPHPVAQILSETVAAAHAAGGEAPAASPGSTLFEYFYDEKHAFWSARNRVLTPVIVFDQFEEIFTLGSRDTAAAARRGELHIQLADLAARRPPVALVHTFEDNPELAARYSVDRTRCRLLFSMREDFLPELGSLREFLPTLASGGLRLQRLRGHQARDVLEKPGSHLLEPGAAERIIRFVAAEKSGAATSELSQLEIEPALLNVVARELNTRRQKAGLERISADLVQGARDEILTDFYERAFDGLDGRVREFIEDQLLTTTGFRDSVAVEDAEASFGVSRDTLAQLVDRRLLRIDERFQMQRVELTHDLLTGVVKVSRDRRREREAAAAAQRRIEAEKLAAQEAAASAHARLKRTRMRAAVVGVMSLLAIGIGGMAYLNHQEKLQTRRIDAERNDAIKARAEADTERKKATASLSLANEAMANSLLGQTNTLLLNRDFDAARVQLAVANKQGLLDSAELSWLAAAMDQPRILQLEATAKIDAAIRQFEFIPAGRLLILTNDGLLRIVDPVTAGATSTLVAATAAGALSTLHDASAIDVLRAPDALLAVGTRGGTVDLYSLDPNSEGNHLATLPLTDHPVATGDEKSDTHEGEAVAAHNENPASAVLRLRFSPDGRSLAAIMDDGRVVAWTVAAKTSWADARIQAKPQSKDDQPPAATLFLQSTSTGSLAFKKGGTEHTQLSWALDGSMMVADGQRGAWLMPPGEKWETQKPIETFDNTGLTFAIKPDLGARNSEWWVANDHESRVFWLHLPADSAEESKASISRPADYLADTVHGFAAIPGSDIFFGALRNESIVVYRAHSAGDDNTLRLLQTVPCPRARNLELRVRDDGNYLAAASGDGTLFLYRIALPSPVPDTAAARLTWQLQPDGQGGWLQLSLTGEWRRTGATITSGSISPDDLKKCTAVASYCRGADPQRALVLATGPIATDPDKKALGIYSIEKKSWLWQRPLKDLGLAEDSEAVICASFSPDGATVAVGAKPGQVLLITADDGSAASANIQTNGDPQQVAWSGDRSRLAIADSNQDIVICDSASPNSIVAVRHARHSTCVALALDQTGRTLSYSTPDGKLILELITSAETEQTLVVPLDGTARGLALAQDPSGVASIALVAAGELRQLHGKLADSPELEWADHCVITGYRAKPLKDVRTVLDHLDTKSFSNDQTIAAAARLIREWNIWLDDGARLLHLGRYHADKATPFPLDAIEEHRTDGASLGLHFREAATGSPELREIADHLQSTTTDILGLSLDLAPTINAVDRWPIAAHVLAGSPHSQAVADFVRTTAFSAALDVVRERNKNSTSLSDAERENIAAIADLFARDPGNNEKFWESRSLLRGPVMTDDQWSTAVFGSHNEWLLEREASTLSNAGEFTESNRFYSELERMAPASLVYTLRRGYNLGRLGQTDDALAIFSSIIAKATGSSDGETRAEALIYRAWAYATLKRDGDADADMDAAVAAAPEEPWTLRRAIDNFFNKKAYDHIKGWTERLVRVQPTAYNQVLHARYVLATDGLDAARPLLQSVATGNEEPDATLDAADVLGISTLHSDRQLQADWVYAAYMKTSDADVEVNALLKLGSLWAGLNNFVSATNAYNRLLSTANYKLSDEQKVEILSSLGWVQTWMRTFDEARDSFDKAFAIEQDPASFVWIRAAYESEWSGDQKQAIERFTRATSNGGADSFAVLIRAYIRFKMLPEAQQTLDQALERFPDAAELRLLRGQLLFATDPAAAARELAPLDDKGDSATSLQVACLLGRALEAANQHLKKVNDGFAEANVEQAGYRALAFRQSGDSQQRLVALSFLSDALADNYRGDLRLHYEFGLDSLASDPVFQLAEKALAAPFDSADSVLDTARFNARLRTEFSASKNLADMFDTRTRDQLSSALDRKIITAAEIQADSLLAPFAPH